MPLDTIIELKNAFIYQDDHLVLSNVNIQINKGDFVYLIGKTGTGKSSILKTLYGALPLKDGEGMIGEFDLANLKRKQIPYLRRSLGIVFQDFELLSDRTVNDNLLFVLKATGWKNKSEMELRMQEVLDKVGMGNKGYKMPHELSGGEQQRVSVARALLNDPSVILADEPTGNLDPYTTEEILNLLFDISKNGRAVLMATHDYVHMKKFSSRIIRCIDNSVISEKAVSENV
ncbi:MAG: cell division ATP-binding protein FtsE [Cryomorphaceae bacterium]|nr:ATP-binding cassette domain-containing protein [Flavobacteriales bacterium]